MLKNLKKLTTTRRGYIGESIVIDYLLKKNLRLYAPVIDDFHIDLVAEKDNKYTTMQVKYHCSMFNDTSIQVKVTTTTADWIVTPVHVDNNTHIIWYKNTRKNKKYTIAFAISKPKNNQVKKINFYKSFLKCPFD